MDLSKYSDADYEALKKGNIQGLSDAGYLTYKQQVQQSSQAQAAAANPPHIPDAADKADQNNSPNAQPVSLVGNKNFPSSYSLGGMPAQAAQDNPEANSGFAKVGTGLALGGLAAGEAAGAGTLSQAGVNAGASGLQKYFSNLIDNQQDPIEGVVGQAALGGGASAALSGVGGGAGKLADWLQQKAVGMRKYLPGVGTSLLDQGVVGTKNMMTNQVGDKLVAEEKNLQDLVSSLKGNVDAQEIGDAISQHSQRFKLPSTGDVAPNMSDYLGKVKQAADQFQSSGEGGELSPQDLLAVKRQGDWVGYTNSGSPATSLDAELGRAQADKARGLLSDMSDQGTSDSLGRERALILAKKALEKPEAIHQGVGSGLFFGKVPGTSLGSSLGAQALQKGISIPSTTAADPRVLQSLFGLKDASQN